MEALNSQLKKTREGNTALPVDTIQVAPQGMGELMNLVEITKMSKKTLNQSEPTHNLLRSLTFNDWVFIITVGCGVVGLLGMVYIQRSMAYAHETGII